MPDLGSTLSLNSSAFAAGIAAARAKLTELNTALIENRNKMKEVSKEAQELQKRERELSAEMKDGGTKEQQQEMQQLRDRIGQVNAELGTLRTREREIQSDIRKASNELDNQKNGMNNLANAGDGVANSLKKIETGLKSVFTMAATKKLVDFFIGSNAEMEQYLTSFEVMLGDAKKASELMSSLNDMAAKTPMELTDVVSTGTLLMNYGVSADELIAKMTQLGDLASGNAVKFERVSLAYGQMLAKLSSISGISKNMSTLSGAVSEQKKSGALSTDTVADIIGTEYEKALTVGIDGKITLDTDKLKTVLSEEIDKAIKDLEESLKTAEKGDIPALEAQIQAFKSLKESISEVTEGLYGVKEKLVSDEEIKVIEESANRRLKLIDAELKAKQKLRDETLKAIDEEVQARKRLTEDNDIQRQIDQVMAQLKYSQLDDFSRSQLERKLQSLKNDKADMIWERGIEDRKAAVNEQFDADSERLNAEKDAINNSLEVLNKLNDTVASGINDLGETIKAAMEAVKPDSTVNITLNNADKMTAEQLYAFIEQQYGSTGAI